MKCFHADADTISANVVADSIRESSHLKLHDRRGISTKKLGSLYLRFKKKFIEWGLSWTS